jgi:hypothetical protein
MWSWKSQVNEVYKGYASKAEFKGRFFLSFFDDYPDIMNRSTSPSTDVDINEAGGGGGGIIRPKAKPHYTKTAAAEPSKPAAKPAKPAKSTSMYRVTNEYDEHESFVNDPDFLRIRVGDIIDITEIDRAEGWSWGSDMAGNEGYVATSYIKKV